MPPLTPPQRKTSAGNRLTTFCMGGTVLSILMVHATFMSNDRDKVLREPGMSWDDVPSKVLGRRVPGVVSLETAAGFLQLGATLGGGKVYRPRGVFRFTSHEEADAWWLNTLKIK